MGASRDEFYKYPRTPHLSGWKGTQTAREQCREHLRAGRDFAFNATNTSLTRKRWIHLFADYGAWSEIVYLEPPLATICEQNSERPDPVPGSVISRLVEKLEPPTWTKAHAVRFIEIE